MPADHPQSALDLLIMPVSDFVDTSYLLFLGRHPGPSEVSEQSGSLRGGVGRLRFLADLGLSAEHRARRSADVGGGDTAFLEDLYMRYLGRPIDPQGMDRYMRMLARGKSRKRIFCDVVRSAEARSKRTFWFELDRMLADERAGRHWLRRWHGRARRQARQENRMQEAMLRNAFSSAFPAAPMQKDSSPEFPNLNTADVRTELSREALHVLARLRAAHNNVAGRA